MELINRFCNSFLFWAAWIIIPVMMETNSAEPLMRRVVAGLASNVILLAAAWGLWQVAQRLRG